jgi:hypothetical protein
VDLAWQKRYQSQTRGNDMVSNSKKTEDTRIINCESNTQESYCKIEHNLHFQESNEILLKWTDESNILNLQYFFLLEQKLGKKFKLSIKYEGTSKERIDEHKYTITDYLAIVNELVRPRTNQILFNGTTIKEVYNKVFRRVLPLIEVNMTAYKFLSEEVCNVFAYKEEQGKRSFKIKRNESCSFISSNSSLDTTSRFIFKSCGDYLFQVGSKEDFEYTKKASDYVKNSWISYFQKPEFFEKMEHSTVLAFLIFCVRNTFLVNDRWADYKTRTAARSYKEEDCERASILPGLNASFDNRFNDRIEADSLNANDIADGLLQLIENVVFHAGDSGTPGHGFMSMRIHSIKGSSAGSLKTQFESYFNGHDNRHSINDDRLSDLERLREMKRGQETNVLPEVTDELLQLNNALEERKSEREKSEHYLEIRIVDYSGKSICQSFNSKTEQDYHQERVSAFFSPNKTENEKAKNYAKQGENIVHHYGLQLFDALIMSLDGCIVVQSISDTDRQKNQDFDSCYKYSSSGDFPLSTSEKTSELLSGTQYSILVPFKGSVKQGHSYINAELKYKVTSNPNLDYDIISKERDNEKGKVLTEYISSLDVSSDDIRQYSKCRGKSLQESKENSIRLLTKILKKLTQEHTPELVDSVHGTQKIPFDRPPEQIIHIHAENDLSLNTIELFVKSIILWIKDSHDSISPKMHIAISDCSKGHFIRIVRMLMVFYDRAGLNEYMRDVQIYLVGEDCKDEFLFAGENLKTMLVVQTKLSFARGISTYITNILVKLLEAREGEPVSASVDFVPFDLLIEDACRRSVFERNLEHVLNANIQEDSPGCKIQPIHMRIGSTIHLDIFYEAEVLFYNSYFNNRFATILASRLRKEIEDKEDKKPLLFIGYGTYSEMLISELMGFFVSSEYCIFEHKIESNHSESSDDANIASSIFFKNLNNLRARKYHFVFLVPINTTTTTFSKLEAELNDALEQSPKKISSLSSHYLAIVQIRNKNGQRDQYGRVGLEKEYFDSADCDNKVITSKLLQRQSNNLVGKVHYLTEITANWYSPSDCEKCYPKDGCYILEEPLIETDKTSVIPSLMFGRNSTNDDERNKETESQNEARLKDLNGFIRQGHLKRGFNHYKYYIETREYFEKYKQKIESWCKSIKQNIVPDVETETLSYNIIIHPVHFSNSTFVKMINDTIFDGTALVISVDIEKEFRDNFLSKHHDLRNLYDNLSTNRRIARIDFHYVDDSITRGASYAGIKSLAQSLFSSNTNHDIINLNIFKTVIVLLNRLSPNSILNYVKKKEDYYYYLNLNISSLRVHGNACVVCNEELDKLHLCQSSSLSKLSSTFYGEFKDLRLDDAGVNRENTLGPINPNEAFRNAYCSHELSTAYSEKGNEKNNPITAFQVLIRTISTIVLSNNNKDEKMQYLLSLITVASTPFISFRKSFKEAAFVLNIILFEMILDSDAESLKGQRLIEKFNTQLESYDDDLLYHNQVKDCLGAPELQSLLDIVLELIKDGDSYYNLLKKLIEVTVQMKSTYILRAKKMERLLELSENLAKSDFPDCYLAAIKTLITLGQDEAKALYLENYLLTGNEQYQDKNNAASVHIPFIFGLESSLKKSFYQELYLENTKVLYEASGDLLKGRNPNEDENYFFSNFKRFVEWNGEDVTTIENPLRELYSSFKETRDKNQRVEEYYADLSKKLQNLLSASSKLDDNDIEVYFLNPHFERSLIWFDEEQRTKFLQYSKEKQQEIISSENKDEEIIEYICSDSFQIGSVLECNRLVYDCFASSQQEYERRPLDELLEEITARIESKRQNGAIFSYAKFEYDACEKMVLPGYDSIKHTALIIGINDSFCGDNESDIEQQVYLLVKIPSTSLEDAAAVDSGFLNADEFQQTQLNNKEFIIFKMLRYSLLFRNRILKQVKRDFSNNLLQSHLEEIRIQSEITKVRSGYHADQSDTYNPLNLANDVYRTISKTLEEFKLNNKYGCEQALFGSLVSTEVGRVNTKLLCKADIDSGSPAKPRKFYQNLTSFYYLPIMHKVDVYFNKTKACQNQLAIFFKDEYEHRGLRTKQEKLSGDAISPYEVYVDAFVADLVHSAARNKKTTENVRVDLEIDEDGFLWIENEIETHELLVEKIRSGLFRRGDGISLASICGYYARFFSEDNYSRVRIKVENNKIRIGLPIFERGTL